MQSFYSDALSFCLSRDAESSTPDYLVYGYVNKLALSRLSLIFSHSYACFFLNITSS